MSFLNELRLCCMRYLGRLVLIGGALQFVAWITGRAEEIVRWGSANEIWLYKALFVTFFVSVVSDMLVKRLITDAERDAQP